MFIYSVFVCVVGMYVVMALFVAILLERFGDQDDNKFEMENQMDEVSAAGPGRIFAYLLEGEVGRRWK